MRGELIVERVSFSQIAASIEQIFYRPRYIRLKSTRAPRVSSHPMQSGGIPVVRKKRWRWSALVLIFSSVWIAAASWKRYTIDYGTRTREKNGGYRVSLYLTNGRWHSDSNFFGFFTYRIEESPLIIPPQTNKTITYYILLQEKLEILLNIKD